MKIFLAALLLVISLPTFANESFDCDFWGPNLILSIDQNDNITLKNSFKAYSCQKGFVNFPGTEVELRVLNCSSKTDKAVYYYAESAEGNILLSKNLGITKDVVCKKL